jgi:hypothetical protein
MPYIKADDGRREALQRGEPALIAGELNYQIFYYVKHNRLRADFCRKTIERFVKQFLGKKPNYQKYNDITGALVRCEREIYRRLGITTAILRDILNSYDDEIARYEDIKICENKDVE